VLGKPLLPDLQSLALWALWSLGAHWVQVQFFRQTLGERIWGIQRTEDLGTLEVRLNLMRAFSNLIITLTLFTSTLVLFFVLAAQHPMLQRIQVTLLEAIEPKSTVKTGFEALPLYYTFGLFPTQTDGEPVLYDLPYAKGPPHRFPPEVILTLPASGNRIIVEGPRTPRQLQGARAKIRSCLTSENLRVRFSWSCLQLRKSLFSEVTLNMLPGGQTPRHWEARWVEVGSQVEDSETRAVGLEIRAQSSAGELRRMLLITPEGHQQSLSLDLRNPPKHFYKDATTFETILRSLIINARLEPQLAWLKEFSAKTQPKPSSTLPEIQASIAKATIQPANFEHYFKLATASLSLLRAQTKNPVVSAALAHAQPQALAALRYMKDIAPSDVRTKRLEQEVLDMKTF
ncbi:hypothetical protein EBZ37_11700, partial [bacterium]|nr:hypothetical protein [bacterium]